MRFVLLTSDSNELGCSLMKAYLDGGGPPFSAVIVTPERKDLDFPTWAKPLAAAKLVGARASLKWLRRRLGGRFLSDEDHAAGYHLGWPAVTLYGGATLVHIESLNDEHGIATLAGLQPDLIVSIGFPQIIGASALAVAPLGGVNLHNGRLPEYRGHFGTFWERFNRETTGYVTLHRMEERVDSGTLIEESGVSMALPFADVLEEKKRIGGAILARALRHVAAHGQLPLQADAYERPDAKSAYYGWPTVGDLIRL